MATFEDLERAIEALPDADFQVFVDASKCVAGASVVPELYAKWGVLVVEVKAHLWPRPKELDILPAWRFEYGFRVLAPAEHEGGSFLRRHGAGLIPAEGNPIDQILEEIRALQDGIARIRKEEMNADDLMAEAREDWKGEGIFQLVDYLKKRPAAELAPHVVELVDNLLANPRISMGVLDVIATSGPAAFRSVADRVYAHEDDREWVLELLGRVGDAAPEAIAMYREALEGDDDDEREKAFAAVKAISKSPESHELVAPLRAGLDSWDEEPKAEAIALLGFLDEDYVALVEEHLEQINGDAFGTLLRALDGLDVSKLAPKFLAKYRALDPNDRTTLEAIEGLVGLDIEERATMEPIVREHFLPRGGFWKQRAEKLLARWA